MELAVERPGAPVDGVVSHYTYFRDLPLVHLFDRFLPDGNIELVINLREPPQRVVDNQTLKPLATFRGAWLSGTRTQPITIPSGRGAELFIVHFRRGRAASLLGLPLSELTDRIVTADDCLPRVISELRQRLLDAATAQDKFTAASAVLARHLVGANEPHALAPRVIDALESKPGAWTVAQLESLTGYTSRYLARRFQEAVGVAPKTWLRLMRFRLALERLQQPSRVAQIAVDLRYCDQSHLDADFLEFSGMTPTLYRARQPAGGPYVPVG